jgi:dephospho-CoA kinase
VIVVGLTGSIGMGKSATATLFAEAGVPVWDADATVHRLYARGGAAVEPVGAAFPEAVKDGAVDRTRLGALVHGHPEAFRRLEELVHPLVALDRTVFLDQARAAGAPVAVLDVPLLFETGGDGLVDAVVVVSAPADVQRSRVLARPGMDEAKFAALLERQTPHAHKLSRADFVIDTAQGFEAARTQLQELLTALSQPGFRSRRSALDAAGEPPQ